MIYFNLINEVRKYLQRATTIDSHDYVHEYIITSTQDIDSTLVISHLQFSWRTRQMESFFRNNFEFIVNHNNLSLILRDFIT